jgi:N-sulfoglucosamine sulfohydrolase
MRSFRPMSRATSEFGRRALNRRDFGKAVLATAALAAAGNRRAAARAKRPPNVLVLIADDAGARHFGCYGNRAIRTPNVDRLSSQGLTCDKAMLTTPQCSPSRISILTGRYPHATGAEDLHMPMPAGTPTVHGRLREAGYFTGHLGKAHEGAHSDRQFDWYEKDLESFPAFFDAAGTRPFFLWAAFHDPHRPYEAGAIDAPHDSNAVSVPPYLADTAETRADLARYYDEVARMDASIGRILAALDGRGLERDTLVVFLSDNGAPFPREKGTVYDAGVRTPLVFRWPGAVPEAERSAALVSVVDLAPTFLELAGVPATEWMQGESIAPGLREPKLPGRAAAFSERNWHDCDEHIRSVRTARYRLVHNAYVGLPFCSPADVSASPSWRDLFALKESGRLTNAQRALFEVPRPEIEFYDTERDPFEVENLAARPEFQARIAEHYALLQDWRRTTGDFPPERRRRAGYADRVTGVLYSLDVPPMIDP